MSKPIFVLDGTQFSSMKEFAPYFSDLVLKDFRWNGDLNAFNDILRGGCGTPDGGFILRWENSALSRERLAQFDTLVEIIRDHGPGGDEEEDGVELQLL